MNNHTLYWYHLKTQTDPYLEGYIGVTNDMSRRHLEHMRNSNGLINHFYNAIEYYGKNNIILTILYTNINEQEAYDLESLYRSEPNTGWNFAIGGKETLGILPTTKVTLFHQSNPKKEYTFKSITKASKTLNITHERISQALIRKSNIYGRDGWSVLHENTNKLTILTISEVISKRFKNKKKNYSNPNKGKKVWSEEDKKRISSQHKGKKISEKQKETVRLKNQLNHTSCKEIQLNHIDEPNKIHTFHSISEASRQLNIPLSRLKSKCIRTLGKYGNDGWCIIKLGSQDSSNE